MTAVNETTLPGVGIRHDFVTKAGDRIGVILHHNGRRDLLIYDQDDPDSCQNVMPLSDNDSHSLADLLGATQIKDDMEKLQQALIGGLVIDWVRIRDQWQCSGRSIGQLGVRAKTGVSIIAVMRAGDITPSPGAEFELHSGDTVVVIGTPSGLQAANVLLQGE